MNHIVKATSVSLLLVFCQQSTQGQDCTEGWDCPGDYPTPPAAQSCSYPVYDMYYQLIGLQWGMKGFGAPATDCCLSTGEHVPLAKPGSVREGMSCGIQVMFMGIIPEYIEGLACRCVPN